jgi:hypothetical protein
MIGPSGNSLVQERLTEVWKNLWRIRHYLRDEANKSQKPGRYLMVSDALSMAQRQIQVEIQTLWKRSDESVPDQAQPAQ